MPNKFRAHLEALFEEEPVVDGETHRAQAVLAEMLSVHPADAPGWMTTLFTEYAASSPTIAADFLRCLGRCDAATGTTWATAIVRQALRHADATLRDAAVAVIDQWQDPALIADLRPADEPKPWLAEYMRQILQFAAA